MTADYDAIKQAVKDAMKEEMKDFYIDREEHYQHHMFIKSFKGGVEACQSTIGKVALSSIIVGILTVMVIGFIGWAKKSLGIG